MKRLTLNQNNFSNQPANLRPGFTIVEILITIVVISILAIITVVAYNGIQQNARIVSLQSDLSNADASLALAYTQNGTYPANLASAGLTASPGTTYQYTYKSSDKSYCLTATNGGVNYMISTANPTPAPGVCPVVAPTAPTAPTNLAATGGTTQISLTWTASTDDGGSAITGYKLYRDTTANPTTLVQTLGNVTSYNDTGLLAGTTYYYRITATNSIGDSPYSVQATATVLVAPVNLAFNPTATGQTGTIQTWTVPATGTYTIEVWGAQGGSATGSLSALGGFGARMKGDFSLTTGQVVKILVGQMGVGNVNDSGGGGGTFVQNQTSNTLLIAAGGGGGASYYSGYIHPGVSGTTATSGTLGTGSGAGTPGSGGTGGSGSLGASGGGYTGNGASAVGYPGANGGLSFTNGGTGGAGITAPIVGGFGGGGGAHGNSCIGGGGGGGYSGGTGTLSSCGGAEPTGGGGGGGSYNSGTNQSNTAGARTGQGFVTIHN